MEDFTERLHAIAKPYLGRPMYGRLHTEEPFPHSDGHIHTWLYSYDIVHGSTASIGVGLDAREKRWGVSIIPGYFSEPLDDADAAADYVRRSILWIPKRRKDALYDPSDQIHTPTDILHEEMVHAWTSPAHDATG